MKSASYFLSEVLLAWRIRPSSFCEVEMIRSSFSLLKLVELDDILWTLWAEFNPLCDLTLILGREGVFDSSSFYIL